MKLQLFELFCGRFYSHEHSVYDLKNHPLEGFHNKSVLCSNFSVITGLETFFG